MKFSKIGYADCAIFLPCQHISIFYFNIFEVKIEYADWVKLKLNVLTRQFKMKT